MGEGSGEDALERDEADVDRHQVDLLGEILLRKVAGVNPLPQDHPGVRAQPLVNLTISDVDAVDLGRAGLQQTVGETARTGADICAEQPRNPKPESPARALNPQSSPRSEP